MSAPKGHRFYGNQYKKGGGGGGSRGGAASAKAGRLGGFPVGHTRKGATSSARAKGKQRAALSELRLGGWSPKRRAMLKARAGVSSRTNLRSKFYKGASGRIGSGTNPYKRTAAAPKGKRKGAYATGKLKSKSAQPGRVGSIHAGTRRGARGLNQGQRVSLGRSRARKARRG